MHTATRQQLLITGTGTAVAVVAGLVTWALWPKEQPPAPRQREYKATTACLLTDDHGLDGDLAKAAWAGMQEASLATRIKVQYLSVTGPQTTANALTYYNTLGIRNCTVIIAAGGVPAAAMVAGQQQFPRIQQVAIGEPAPAAPAGSPGAATGTASVPPSAGSPSAAGSAVPAGPVNRNRVVTVDAGAPTAVQQRVKAIVAAAAG